MKKNSAAILLILSLFITGCTQNSKNIIKIASVTPLSGSQAAIGESIKQGIEMAYKENIKEFQDLGFKLIFIPQDDQADPKVGVAVAQKLIADKNVLGVVGHFNSGVAIPSSAVYDRKNLCMVSPANTAVEVTERRLLSVNRICARDDMQAPLGADFAVNDLKVKKIFIIHDKTAYGQGIADEFKKRAIANGAKIVGFEAITPGENDFSAVLNNMAYAKPELLYFAGIYPEGSLIIKQMKEKNIQTIFLGPDGMDSEEVINIAGEHAVGTYYTSPAADITLTAKGKKWANKFKTKYGKAPENWTAYGYDAMSVLLKALKAVIAENNNLRPQRIDVCKAVRKIQDYKGIVSDVSFDDKGDNKQAVLYIAKFEKAKYPPSVIKKIRAYK